MTGPVEHRRSAVVSRREQAVRLTQGRVASTTFQDVMTQPDAATMAYFADNQPAVLWVTPATARTAEAAANRLRRLGVAIRVHRVPQR